MQFENILTGFLQRMQESALTSMVAGTPLSGVDSFCRTTEDLEASKSVQTLEEVPRYPELPKILP